MYNGYRLKINGTVFPDKYIAKGTYDAYEKKRVVELWKDENQTEHEITTATPKAYVSFSLVEHLSDEHAAIVAFLQNNDNITLNYYSPRLDSYRTVTCRMNDIQFPNEPMGNKLFFKATKVTFIEN